MPLDYYDDFRCHEILRFDIFYYYIALLSICFHLRCHCFSLLPLLIHYATPFFMLMLAAVTRHFH